MQPAIPLKRIHAELSDDVNQGLEITLDPELQYQNKVREIAFSLFQSFEERFFRRLSLYSLLSHFDEGKHYIDAFSILEGKIISSATQENLKAACEMILSVKHKANQASELIQKVMYKVLIEFPNRREGDPIQKKEKLDSSSALSIINNLKRNFTNSYVNGLYNELYSPMYSCSDDTLGYAFSYLNGFEILKLQRVSKKWEHINMLARSQYHYEMNFEGKCIPVKMYKDSICRSSKTFSHIKITDLILYDTNQFINDSRYGLLQKRNRAFPSILKSCIGAFIRFDNSYGTDINVYQLIPEDLYSTSPDEIHFNFLKSFIEDYSIKNIDNLQFEKLDVRYSVTKCENFFTRWGWKRELNNNLFRNSKRLKFESIENYKRSLLYLKTLQNPVTLSIETLHLYEEVIEEINKFPELFLDILPIFKKLKTLKLDSKLEASKAFLQILKNKQTDQLANIALILKEDFEIVRHDRWAESTVSEKSLLDLIDLCPKIKALDLSEREYCFTDKLVKKLVSKSNLNLEKFKMHLSENSLTNEGLEYLASNCPKLKEFETGTTPSAITDEGIYNFCQKATNLRRFRPGASNILTNASLEAIVELPNLAFLHIEGVNITSEGIRSFIKKSNSNLKGIFVGDAGEFLVPLEITNEEIKQLMKERDCLKV